MTSAVFLVCWSGINAALALLLGITMADWQFWAASAVLALLFLLTD
mgnify:CR=1 FL=1